MYMYLPIALTSVNYLVVIGLGLSVGLLSGLFGVGGGFLMTPLLMMIGIPPTIAAATDANQIVAASASGTFAHWRLGNVDVKMGVYLLVGGFLGGAVGVQVIKLLRATGGADFLIKMTYVVMLGLVGSFMFVESIHAMRKKKVASAAPAAQAKVAAPAKKRNTFFASLPLQVYFEKSGVTHSALVPLFLGTFVGVLAAIMGVGGGFLMVPVMVYMLRMPMHVVVGTSLFQILFTCINVTVMQSISNHNVDIVLAIILLVGSTLGAQLGAKFSRKLKADQLKILLASIVLLVMVQILVGLLLAPDFMLGYKAGH